MQILSVTAQPTPAGGRSSDAEAGKLDITAFGDGQPLEKVAGRDSDYKLKSPPPQVVKVTAKQTRPFAWEASGEFDVRPNGVLAPRSGACPAEFLSPAAGRDAVSNQATIRLVVSRLRDVTRIVGQQLREQTQRLPSVYAGHEGELRRLLRQRNEGQRPLTRDQNHWLNAALAYTAAPTEWRTGSGPVDWGLPSRDGIHVINPKETAVAGGAINAAAATVSIESLDRVFFVAGVTSPQLVAVSWPDAVAKSGSDRKIPMLFYFRPTTGQNYQPDLDYDPTVEQGRYPLGFDYLYWGFWQYLNYKEDPLTGNAGWKGLPYQIGRSGKNAVLVMPLPRNPADGARGQPEFGRAGEGPWVRDLLRDIVDYTFRADARARNASPGVAIVDRLGLAAFSSGNGALATFVNAAANRDFVRSSVHEVYGFDPPRETGPTLAAFAARWATGDKRACIYRRLGLSNDQSYVGSAVGNRLSLTISPDTNRVLGILPDSAWTALARARGAPADLVAEWIWQHSHQIIASMMLTDALRRSSFPGGQ